jgi:hypothetical protein
MSLIERLRWVPILAFLVPMLLLIVIDRHLGRRD